ncbi:MAG: hypothetical protein WC450_06055 [Candidatus Omnitrophota bacterium]
MSLFSLEPTLFVVCLLVYLLPGVIYVFYALKWKKAQKGILENKHHDDIEAWWDLVIEKEGKSPGSTTPDLASLCRKQRRWLLIMISSWIAGTIVIIGIL